MYEISLRVKAHLEWCARYEMWDCYYLLIAARRERDCEQSSCAYCFLLQCKFVISLLFVRALVYREEFMRIISPVCVSVEV